MRVIINNKTFKVKLCATPNTISQGMMGQTFNEDFSGMLFMLPTTGEQSFWTYKCIIPLDIIMFNNGEITKIHYDCQPCVDQSNCESYKGFGSGVLEVLGGTCELLNIKEGDTLSFSLN